MRLAVILIAVAALAGLAFWQFSRTRSDVTTAEAPATATEVCGVRLAGSNTIGELMAASIVADFLRYNKFDVSPPVESGRNEQLVVGERGANRCSVAIYAGGTSHAFEELSAGKAQIGMASRAIKTKEIAELREVGAGDFEADAAKAEHVVALDGLSVIVHPRNRLKELSKRDIKRIFLGQVTNWREVGGAPGQIRAHARDDESGTYQFFRDHVLENDARWKTAQEKVTRYTSSSELAAAVAQDPNAIGFVGGAYVTEAVKALNVSDGGPAFEPSAVNVRSENYPISRRLYLYVRPETYDNNPIVRNLIAYFKSAAAFDEIERLHYISLRASEPTGRVTSNAVVACQSGTPESEVYRRATQDAARLPSVIRFAPAGNTPDSLARDDLERLYPTIETSLAGGAKVLLIGHSDGAGASDVNRRLAMERAVAVRTAYENRGILGLQVESAGEMCPVADNETAEGRRINRRVEIWISRGGSGAANVNSAG